MKKEIQKLLERYREIYKSCEQGDKHYDDCSYYRNEGRLGAYEDVICDLENLLGEK